MFHARSKINYNGHMFIKLPNMEDSSCFTKLTIWTSMFHVY
jgi:hypothetical protein